MHGSFFFKNQNEVGVFAFYVFFEADIDKKLSTCTVAIQSVARDEWYKRVVRQYIHFIH